MLGAHGPLGFGAEKVERKHIEEDVHEAAMQKHVGNWLPKKSVADAVQREGEQGI